MKGEIGNKINKPTTATAGDSYPRLPRRSIPAIASKFAEELSPRKINTTTAAPVAGTRCGMLPLLMLRNGFHRIVAQPEQGDGTWYVAVVNIEPTHKHGTGKSASTRSHGKTQHCLCRSEVLFTFGKASAFSGARCNYCNV